MGSFYKKIKRLTDIAVAGSVLSGSIPLLFFIAMAVKFDSPGPAIFRQKRLGKGGRIFEILKFRTMYSGASVVIGSDNTVLNSSSDDRVTKIGKLLRKTSIDELPQLINILSGDMSLIGPRPDLPEALDMYKGEERTKLNVKPGITGFAQVSGRNLLDARQKWALDVQYAKNVSLSLDVKIIVKTILKVIEHEGIYKEID